MGRAGWVDLKLEKNQDLSTARSEIISDRSDLKLCIRLDLNRDRGLRTATSTTYLGRHEMAHLLGTKRLISFSHPLLIVEIIHSNLTSRMFNHGDEVLTTH
jgi:hypothetical protein